MNHTRISARHANTQDTAQVATLNLSGVDVIIDDGLHSWEAQQQTLVNMWPSLREGGYYFIEDVATAQQANNSNAARILAAGGASFVQLGTWERQHKHAPGNMILLRKRRTRAGRQSNQSNV